MHPALDSGLLDPLLTFYRELLVAQEELNHRLSRQQNDQAETNRYLQHRIDAINSYCSMLENRVTDLTDVIMTTLATGHPTTRDEVTYLVREQARTSPDPDYLWELLMEVETDTEDEMLTEEDFRAIDAFF